jgi:HEAT repeat protein
MEEGQTRSLENRDEEKPADADELVLRSVVDIFSRLSIACKSRSLYPAEHPAARESVVLLHAVMEDSLQNTPSITVQAVKDSLVYDRWVVGQRMESLKSLASRIRALNIQEISLAAGVSLKEAEELVEMLVLDPEDIDSAGGPENFLLVRGVHSIGVVESEATRADEDAEEMVELLAGEEDEAALDDESRPETLAPDQIEDLINLLLDPEELGRVLMGLSSEDGHPMSKEELADAIFFFLKDAYAIAEREFSQQMQECPRSMAESLLFLDTEVRNLLLLRSMIPKLREEPASPEILNRFNSQEMADMLSQFFPLVPELVAKTKPLLKAIGFREGEIRNTLRLLYARLVDLGQVPSSIIATLEKSLEGGKAGVQIVNRLPTAEEILAILGEYHPEEIDEIRRISEFDPGTYIPAETTPMLIDLLKRGSNLDNQQKAMELLHQNFWGLITSTHLDLATVVVEGLLTLLQSSDPAIDAYRSDITLMLEEATSEAVMQRTIHTAYEQRNKPQVIEDFKHYIDILGDKGVAAMIEVLGNEDVMSVRKYIVDVLSATCQNRISLLGKYIDDERWYLVRNIITIMSSLHSTEIMPYLRRTFYNSNSKVKAETIRALGMTGGYDASELLITGLQEPDEKTRILCIRWLGRLGEIRAVNRLVKMLEDKEPGGDSLLVKKEILKSLGEITMPETFDVLRKYQSKYKRFNRAEWQEVNEAAGEALQRLIAKYPHLERKR